MATQEEKNKAYKEMSFLQHLDQLRWHLVRSAFAVVVFAGLAFTFRKIVFDKILLGPRNPAFFTNDLLCRLSRWSGMSSICINSHPFQIININMAGQFTTHITVSLMAGIICSVPYILWELWTFIKPALYEKEQKYARGTVLIMSLLFFTGVCFGYYIIAPFSVHFLGSYSVSDQVVNNINLDSYLSIITAVVFAGGIVFELPVIIFFLTKIGLVTPQFLVKYRKHAIIVNLIVAAVISTPDVFSQVLVAIPLFGLYEAGIVISKRVIKDKLKKEKLAQSK